MPFPTFPTSTYRHTPSAEETKIGIFFERPLFPLYLSLLPSSEEAVITAHQIYNYFGCKYAEIVLY